MNEKSANLLSLFASSSTLICCALPALLVSLGAGAAFANLITVFPFLVILSQYKIYISLFALVIITIAGFVNYRTYHMPCPIDPELGKSCLQTRKRSRFIYYFSVILFMFASTFTYIIPKLI